MYNRSKVERGERFVVDTSDLGCVVWKAQQESP